MPSLVEILPSLAAWLRFYRANPGRIYPSGVNYYQEKLSALGEALQLKIRRTGLRDAFAPIISRSIPMKT